MVDLEKCYMTSSVKLKNQLKIYFKQAFDLFLDLPQALTMNVSYSIYIYCVFLLEHDDCIVIQQTR